MPEGPKLMLIDGHALAFRAFHALANANLHTSSGEPTYAVYGFLQILLTTLQEQQPRYMVVAFDVGRTFRHEQYAEYKAGRSETPPEFHQQLVRIKQTLQALNIPIATAEGYEADDVIGTRAQQATREGLNTVILTGDTDTLQLVNEQVTVLLANPSKTTMTLYDVAQVQERYNGLTPAQLADLRGLKGDNSDNIPGVNGIGEKSATSLLAQFGTVSNLYENLALVPNRYRKKLEGQRDQALFSKQLSVIDCAVPGVTLDVAAAQLDDYDRSAIIRLFQELEFGTSLIQKLPTPISTPRTHQLPAMDDMTDPNAASQQMTMFADEVAAPSPSTQQAEYIAVTSSEHLRQVVDALHAAPGFAFDIESTGLNTNLDDQIVGLSLAVRPGNAWYIPIGHREGTQLDASEVFDALRPLFLSADKPKFAHHAKFDIELLHQAGIEIHRLAFDTMLAAQLLGKRSGLKELAFFELKIEEPTEITELIGRGKEQITFDQVSIERATPYAAADADMTLRLTDLLRKELARPHNTQLGEIFERLELPLVPVLVAMEQAGIGVDVAYLNRLHERLTERITDIEQQIYAAAKEPFNINSGDQLSRILFDKLKLPTADLRKTRTGRYSLTADVLEKLAARLNDTGQSHQILDLVLQYRQLAKLRSTYVDALPELVNPHTGRIHTSYHQLGTATGRLSSNNPNLQNIPVRSEEGNAIRRAFVAAPGHVFLAADYSQIELRVLAHICEDANLIQTFRERQDIHAATAAQLFDTAPDQVDKNQRRIAKTVVFGVIYGISSYGLAQRTDLSRSEAQALIDALFARFPGIRAYMDTTLEHGRLEGYVESLFGRRRAVPDLKSGDHNRKRAAEREAINAPIQATAADIMKLAMIQIARELTNQQLQTRMLLQVHDELIFEVPAAELPTVQQMVRRVMEQVCTLQVPLSVNIASGPNWEEMEELTAMEGN